jgi:predicted  nucleic acid-binding Zn-ribbon protein
MDLAEALAKIEALSARVATLEGAMVAVDSELDSIEDDLDSHEWRISGVENACFDVEDEEGVLHSDACASILGDGSQCDCGVEP